MISISESLSGYVAFCDADGVPSSSSSLRVRSITCGRWSGSQLCRGRGGGSNGVYSHLMSCLQPAASLASLLRRS